MFQNLSQKQSSVISHLPEFVQLFIYNNNVKLVVRMLEDVDTLYKTFGIKFQLPKSI